MAVGWSSDILPAAKRMSNVTVVVPKSGASLWADLWVWESSGINLNNFSSVLLLMNINSILINFAFDLPVTMIHGSF